MIALVVFVLCTAIWAVHSSRNAGGILPLTSAEADDPVRHAVALPVFLLAATIGLLLWAALAAYRDPIRDAWLPSAIIAAAILGWVFPMSTSSIGPGMCAGPLLTVGFTVHRGDDSGLWLMIYLMLLVLVPFLAGAAAIGGATHRWRHRSGAADLIIEHRTEAIGVASAACAASLMVLLLAQPNPWRGADEALDALVLPDDFRSEGRERTGEILYIGEVTTSQTWIAAHTAASDACRILGGAIEDLRDDAFVGPLSSTDGGCGHAAAIPTDGDPMRVTFGARQGDVGPTRISITIAQG